MKQIFLIGATFSLLSYPLSFSLASPALATLNPGFSVYLASPEPSSPSNVSLDFSFPEGTEIPTQIDIGIPAGFELSPSSSFPGSTVVGLGDLWGYISGNYYSGFITLYNIETFEGILWNMRLTFPSLPFERGYEIPVSGNSQQGYAFSLPDLASLGLTSPSSWHLTIFGDEYMGDGVAPYVITTPAVGGTYNWTAKFYGAGAETVQLESSAYILSTPVTTPTCEPGQCEAVDLPSDISITFNSVSGGGETTVSASPTTPIPPDSGQFQVVPGGLYYDFTTSATYQCPCLITLPYNPAITPDPRIYHLNMTTGIWEDVTFSVDPVAQTVTGQVSSLSFFVIATSNFNVDWRPPIERAAGKKTAEFSVRIPLIPVIFALTDQNGDFVERDDASVEILKGGILQATITPNLVAGGGRLYKADLKVKSLGLEAGDYQARVKIGNTIFSPSIDFILR